MPRPQSPEVRRRLIDRAAALLARRQPVTLTSLVEGVGVSTMAVYTYFDGMPGLWSAVRQEGFTRLAQRLATVPGGRDPVRHLAALGVAYVDNAVANPDLYRVMFDIVFDLPDPDGAAASFAPLVAGAERARDAGRFRADTVPEDVAMQYWTSGHGVTSLAVTGVLSPANLRRYAEATAVAIFVAAGDEPGRAKASVATAWRASAVKAAQTGTTSRGRPAPTA